MIGVETPLVQRASAWSASASSLQRRTMALIAFRSLALHGHRIRGDGPKKTMGQSLRKGLAAVVAVYSTNQEGLRVYDVWAFMVLTTFSTRNRS